MSKNDHARHAETAPATGKAMSATPSSGGRPKRRPAELGVLLHTGTFMSSEIFMKTSFEVEGAIGIEFPKARMED